MSEHDGLLDLDTAARLIDETPKELERLVSIGAIERDSGRYHPIKLIRGYASHVRAEAQRVNASPTQLEVARHLDMSERNARDVLHALNIDWRTTPLDEIRIAYIRDMREKAAGRGGDDQTALTRARVRDHTASAELKELQIMERSGELTEITEIEQKLLAMITAARTELLTLPDGLAQELRALYGVEVDAGLIEDRIHDALTHLASRLEDSLAGDVAPDGEGVGTAA